MPADGAGAGADGAGSGGPGGDSVPAHRGPHRPEQGSDGPQRDGARHRRVHRGETGAHLRHTRKGNGAVDQCNDRFIGFICYLIH